MPLTIWLLLAAFAAPLVAALVMLALRRSESGEKIDWRLACASWLASAIGFNLAFFWQELWLVVPKALVPDLHPTLYHNDHDWTGSNPIAELLQGTGALATFLTGVLLMVVPWRRLSKAPELLLIVFWFAFHCLYQALAQVALGVVNPGNDVGRAMAYAGLGSVPKGGAMIASFAAMAAIGMLFARRFPEAAEAHGTARMRRLFEHATLPSLAAILLIAPFRVPRDPIEVVVVPLVVAVAGNGWMLLGAMRRGGAPAPILARSPSLGTPAALLALLFLVFWFVLRPGIAF